MKELLRWHAVLPLGIPRRIAEDDVYNGCFLPSGSLIFPNVHGMLHDPRLYQDPEKFDPSRFLPELSGRPAEQDPRAIAFGFGRRICSGAQLADASLFIACARIIAVFAVSKAIENGKVVEPKYEMTPEAVSHPVPFKVNIARRSEQAVGLIRGE